MTALSLLNKLLGVFLRLYLSNRIGAEGMGLYQLIMSIYTMFSTFATAGFTLSVSRLVAEKEIFGNSNSKRLLNVSFACAAMLSALATVLMLACADFMADFFLQEPRAAGVLRILALSMPFMALAACLKGWFLAKQKVIITASASLLEQCVKFLFTALLLGAAASQAEGISGLCTGVVLAVTLSECVSFTYLYLFSLKSRKACGNSFTETRRESLKGLVNVTLPISLSVYLTSILHTAETLLVPRALESYSGDRETALSQFGAIRGMVIPILFFPFAFIQSLISVFTPEISRLNMLSNRAPLKNRLSMLMSFVSLVSVAVGGLFFFLPGELGEAFYPNESTENAIRALALVTPFMYVETVCDGILKAIGEQVKTLKYSVWNSLLRVGLILFWVPKSGGTGYLLLLICSNSFTYFLCRRRLHRAAGIAPKPLADICLPSLFAALSGLSARLLLNRLELSGVGAAIAGSAVYCGMLALLVLLFAKKRVVSLFKRLKNEG